MSSDTKRILELVAAGKVSVEEGARLLAALGAGQPERPPSEEANRPLPRYFKMEGRGNGKDEGFRIRVPLDLLRAGIKMRALIPQTKRDKINEKLREKGVTGDIFEMTDDQIDSLIRTLGELEIEGGDSDGNFRVYLE
ncbi:MAG: SHOCT-like domain-containing protein [Hyphomicrobiaceae bacterium]